MPYRRYRLTGKAVHEDVKLVDNTTALSMFFFSRLNHLVNDIESIFIAFGDRIGSDNSLYSSWQTVGGVRNAPTFFQVGISERETRRAV